MNIHTNGFRNLTRNEGVRWKQEQGAYINHNRNDSLDLDRKTFASGMLYMPFL